MENKKIKIVFAGAHAGTVALALVEEIRHEARNWEVHFIGPKYSFEKGGMPSLEKKYLNKYGVLYHPLISGKFTKGNPFYLIVSLVKTIFGFVSAVSLLNRIKPKAVLSFGGYLGVPVVVGAWILRIPVILHEQIPGVGLGNRISVYFSKKIAMSRSEALAGLPKTKTVLTGNPIRRSIMDTKPKLAIGNPVTIFVFTGSRGSRIINSTLDTVLEKLLSKFKIIHLAGEIDFQYFLDRKKQLEPNFSKRYEVLSFIDPDEVAGFYKNSDILVCRAGANTVSELMVVKRPAILIPIPWSLMNEQYKNAVIARNFGIGRIVEEKDLKPERLLAEVNYMTENWKKIVSAVNEKISPDIGASEKVIKIIEDLL